MGCESCAVAFSVWRRRRACPECGRGVCAACLRRGAGLCASCRVLSARPLARAHIAHLKPRDLQAFLQRQNVSTRGCVEKEELITLCLNHVNSGAYRKPTTRVSSTFSTLKGFTSNINEFINNTFDLRPNPNSTTATQHARASADGSCYNSRHSHTAHAPPPRPSTSNNTTSPTSSATSPLRPPPRSRGGGVGVTSQQPASTTSQHSASTTSQHSASTTSQHSASTTSQHSASTTSQHSASTTSQHSASTTSQHSASTTTAAATPHVDTADCFEIEDVEDAGWEFVERAADPLPNDSEVLLTVNDRPVSPTEQRRPSLDDSQHSSNLEPGDQATQDCTANPVEQIPQISPDELPDEEGIRVTETVDRDSGETGERERGGDNRRGRSSLRPPSFADRESSAAPSPQRAASSLELRWTEARDPDSSSLHDEPAPTLAAEARAVIHLDALGSEQAVLALSVRQLKELLVRNRVEIRGCVERDELQQRATALWRDHTKCREQLESLPLEECCKICMAAPLECVLLECGHMATCTACARVLPECPICRRYVTRAVRFFRS